MDKLHYLAHVAEDGREQTVLAHLEGTAALCAAFAAGFDAGEQGRLAGLAHDIGKYSDAFQRRIRGSPEQVDHATAGAFECMKLGQPLAAFAVAGHHGGLPDGGGRGDSSDQGTFFGRMSRAAQGKLVDYSAWSRELSLPSTAVPSSAVDKLAGMFFTRMLFSCLVDADYTDTGEFMEGQTFGIGETASIEELWARLQSYISGWVPAKRGAERQTLRHPGTVHPARAGTKTGPVYLDRAHRRGQDRGPLWPSPWRRQRPGG